MASRFHQRDARSSLFSTYDQQQTRSRPSSASPAPYSSRSQTNLNAGYGYQPSATSGPAFSAYPGNGSLGTSAGVGSGLGPGAERSRSAQGFRSSFEKKGYSNAVLDELESQNEDQVGEMAKRVGMLKDITMKIGDEIRDSTALAEKMNDQFGNAGTKLKGTMNRMLRMAERTGIPWKVWLIFFAAVILLFWYVRFS